MPPVNKHNNKTPKACFLKPVSKGLKLFDVLAEEAGCTDLLCLCGRKEEVEGNLHFYRKFEVGSFSEKNCM